ARPPQPHPSPAPPRNPSACLVFLCQYGWEAFHHNPRPPRRNRKLPKARNHVAPNRIDPPPPVIAAPARLVSSHVAVTALVECHRLGVGQRGRRAMIASSLDRV